VNILLLRDDLRNLAMKDTPDMKLGTTMSTVTDGRDMCGAGSGCVVVVVAFVILMMDVRMGKL